LLHWNGATTRLNTYELFTFRLGPDVNAAPSGHGHSDKGIFNVTQHAAAPLCRKAT
jgi:hypothetical protein